MTMTLDKYDDPRAVPLPHHGRDHGHDAPTIEPSAPPLSELDAEESTTADYSMPCALATPVSPPALAPRHHYSTRVVATPVTANDDTVERRVERTYEPDGSLSVEVVTTTARRADGSREVRIENYRIPAEDAWGLADGRSPGDECLTRVEVRSLPPGVAVDFGTTASSSSTQPARRPDDDATVPDRGRRSRRGMKCCCVILCAVCTGGVCLIIILFVLGAIFLPNAMMTTMTTVTCDGDHCLQDWASCSSSSECDSACCSDSYDPYGAFKCIPLERAGYDPDICKAP